MAEADTENEKNAKVCIHCGPDSQTSKTQEAFVALAC